VRSLQEARDDLGDFGYPLVGRGASVWFGYPIIHAKVDATVHKEVAAQYGIKGFPTLKYYKNGKFVTDYQGNRQQEDLFMQTKKMYGPPSAMQRSYQLAATMNQDVTTPATVFVMKGDKSGEDSEAFKVWERAASSVMNDYTDIMHTTTAAMPSECEGKDWCLVRFLGGQYAKYNDDIVKVFDGALDADAMEQWLKANKFPKVPELDQASYTYLMGQQKPHLMVTIDGFDLNNGDFKMQNEAMTGLSALYDKYSDRMVFSVAKAYRQLLESYGVEVLAPGDNDKPMYAVIDSQMLTEGDKSVKGKYPVMTDKLGVGNYVDFKDVEKHVEDYFAGKLTSHIKSQADPNPPTENGVVVVTANNWEDVVENNDKDVLVEFYAPWCGHCKNLAPIYAEVALEMADTQPDIVIAKMDATANDIPRSDFEVRGFPTLKLFKKGANASKDQEDFNGRTRDQIVSALSKQAGKWVAEGVDFKKAGGEEKQEL